MAVAPDAILNPPSSVEYPLPEGVFRDPQKGLFYNKLVFKGFYDKDDTYLDTPEKVEAARRAGSPIYEDHDEVPVPCIVPPPWATEEQIESLRKQARLEEKFFFHPGHGWLPWGRKRAVEAPENRGTGSIQRNRRRRTVPTPDYSVVTPEVQAAPQSAAVAQTPVVETYVSAETTDAPRRGRPPGRPTGQSAAPASREEN